MVVQIPELSRESRMDIYGRETAPNPLSAIFLDVEPAQKL